MPWTHPLNGKSRVDHAGDVISGRRPPVIDMSMDTALDIAGNWRSSHGYPLHVTNQSLRSRARKFDSRALVVQRLKRIPAIASKLKRFTAMQLSKMHDLGGCRAVVKTVGQVDGLVSFYEANPYGALEFIKKYDYITSPKNDGYRSVHLVYRYRGNSQGGVFKDLKIEIQIRSRLQHAWATAVEIIDTFTGQGLKSNIGDDSWKRFFVLVGTAMALREKRPIVPNTSSEAAIIVAELRELCTRLKIAHTFSGLSTGVSLTPTLKFKGSPSLKAEAYILILDSESKRTTAQAYSSNRAAQEKYLEIEKENIDKPHIQTVMASSDSVQALRKAYPNYYLDTQKFIEFVNGLI